MKALMVALLVAGVTRLSAASAADPLSSLRTAVGQLAAVTNYSWACATEMPEAPFKIPATRGVAQVGGTVMIQAAQGSPAIASKGAKRAVLRNGEWKRWDQQAGKDSSIASLLSSRTPAQELADLVPVLSHVRWEESGAIHADLDTVSAKEFLLNQIKGHGPAGRMPTIESVSGTVRVWLKEGLPHQYSIAVDATLQLPFGTRQASCISTTRIRDLGSADTTLPLQALHILEN